MNDLIVGILGGMGPEATANLYFKIINATNVSKDQDHFHVIIDSNSKIPDRTNAVLYNGESPILELIKTAKNLEKLNVQVGCLPCITAHNFIDNIQNSVNYPVLNGLELLNEYIQTKMKNVKKIGILATDGTIKTKLFTKYLDGYDVIYPSEKNQKNLVKEAIYGDKGIKKNNDKSYAIELLKKASEDLILRNVDLIIAGCTEIGLVLNKDDLSVKIIDPMDLIVEKIIEMENSNGKNQKQNKRINK